LGLTRSSGSARLSRSVMHDRRKKIKQHRGHARAEEAYFTQHRIVLFREFHH
jgi:hypothetical protein